jgi:hypothetical protein
MTGLRRSQVFGTDEGVQEVKAEQRRNGEPDDWLQHVVVVLELPQTDGV